MNFGTIPHAHDSRRTGAKAPAGRPEWLGGLLGALAEIRVAEREFVQNRKAMREARR